MNWDNVENIRNAQASAQARFDAEHIATQETIKKAMQSEAFQALAVPHLTELESMIFKMRSELIDYIVAHGLVDGLIWDGVLQPVEGGKIVITKELVETITEKLGYYKKNDVERLLGEYLPEHDYVSDPGYIHTDNNYTTEEKDKLAGIEDNAEVNKIIDLVFNGVSVLDDGTRVATITITPEDIKTWYESNPDTNAFTDSEKSKLAGISDGAEVNRVDDVLVDGRSVLDDNKKAKVTKEIIKTAYESNPDTNAFTDSEKQKLADLDVWKPEAQKAIEANAQGVTEAKTSISELGDEVNSVAGRVTTLENTKLSVITVTDAKIKDLAREGFADGFYNLELEFKAVFKDAENHQRTFNGVQLFGYGSLSGGYIGAGSCLYGAYQSAASGLLQSTSFIMNDDLVPVLQFVLDSSKDSGFIPASVTLSEYSLGVGTAIAQIQLDGEQLDVSGGVVNIKGADKYVPYSGATGDVNLGDYAVKALELNTGELVVGTGQLDYTDGITGKNNKLIFSGTDASFTDGTNSTPVFVADPTNDKHAATKKYVDNQLSETAKGYVPYSGLTNNISMNDKDLLDAHTVQADFAEVGSTGLKLTSAISTSGNGVKLVASESGAVARVEEHTSTTLARLKVGTPTEDTDAATKKYVDENTGGSSAGYHAVVKTISGKMSIPVDKYSVAGGLYMIQASVNETLTKADGTTITGSDSMKGFAYFTDSGIGSTYTPQWLDMTAGNNSGSDALADVARISCSNLTDNNAIVMLKDDYTDITINSVSYVNIQKIAQYSVAVASSNAIEIYFKTAASVTIKAPYVEYDAASGAWESGTDSISVNIPSAATFLLPRTTDPSNGGRHFTADMYSITGRPIKLICYSGTTVCAAVGGTYYDGNTIKFYKYTESDSMTCIKRFRNVTC